MHFNNGFLTGNVLCGERCLWWLYAFTSTQARWILLSSHTYTCTRSDEILFLQDHIMDEAYTEIYVGGKSGAVQEKITMPYNTKTHKMQKIHRKRGHC